MNLVKTSLISAIGLLAKLISVLGINKILAIYVGPAGFVILGQYQSLLQLFSTFSTSTINAGIVRYTAEESFFLSDGQAAGYWRVATAYSMFSSVILLLAVFLLGELLASYFLGDANYKSVFYLFSFSFFFFSLNNILIAILNGKRKIIKLTVANTMGSIVSFVLVYLLARSYGVWGALAGFSVYQSFWFLATMVLVRSEPWFKIGNFIGRIEWSNVRDLSKYLSMAAVTALLVPLSQMLLRDFLARNQGLLYAGYWDALVRFSLAYLALATTLLAVYYLPKLATIKNRNDLSREILYCYKIVLPLILVGLITLYLFRIPLIELVYSTEFLPVADIIGYQLVGDFLKIGSWFFSYVMVANARVYEFLLSEFIFTVVYLVTTIVIVSYFGFRYVMLGYAINYALYWCATGWIVFRKNGIADSFSAELSEGRESAENQIATRM